jgi:deoxyribodipyrimidine photolyase-related protein
VTIWILPDQLSLRHSALAEGNPSTDCVLMIESRAGATRARTHKIKLAMQHAAMRHFARALEGEGWRVSYHRLGEDASQALTHHRKHHRELTMMAPNSMHEENAVRKLARKHDFDLRFTPPVQFLRSREDFVGWARGKRRLLMETHYRQMRERLGILVDADGRPEGGRWNLDHENRKAVSDWRREGEVLPAAPPSWASDRITTEAIADVTRWFPQAPGRAEALWLPVTRKQAIEVLDGFVTHSLPRFGDFEDVMLTRSRRVFHSTLSAPINLGLLDPLECVEAAVRAYRAGHAPLNAVEGFVRQIIGWREFINGVYWLRMPTYAQSNELGAVRPLPGWFRTAETPMRCLRTVLQETLDTSYNHHIQRLMVLGNFMLLSGISPQEGLHWFSEMYCDAFEWVMAANVLGMSLHADGGFMATKPYAGSGAYISKMSDYCEGCAYKPSVKHGPRACPFNLLYWDFYDRHAERFAANPRTSMMVRQWRKRASADRQTIVKEADAFLREHVPMRERGKD